MGLNGHEYRRSRLMVASYIVCALLLAACGRERVVPTPTAILLIAAEDPTATPLPPTPQPVTLVDSELLGATGVDAACDHPPEAELTCANVATRPLLTVNVSAATYARWSLRWSAAAQPLTGTETLHLRVRGSGDVAPNLYLVEAGGRRIATNLKRVGLNSGWKELFIPLAEIRNDEGERPNFAAVTELQIVFEWADMAGEVELESVRFDGVWREAVTLPASAHALAASISAPPGFIVSPLAHNLPGMTQIQFTPDGAVLVSLQNGRVWWYHDMDGDSLYDERHLYTTGLTEVVGLLPDPVDGGVWLGGRGQLYHTQDTTGDGVADRYDLRLDGLPWGRHQNNGLAWNPDPDPFSGEDGAYWIYFGLGSTEDLETGGDLNATVLRFPRGGQGQESLEVVSRGNRNAYMVAWGAVPVVRNVPEGETVWQLFASENGPDFNDAPDEVNHIRWQHHYGFPTLFGTQTPAEAEAIIDGLPYAGALYNVTPHASASGLAYVSNPAWPAEYRSLYVSLFGQVFSPNIVGHTVERIALEPITTATGITYRGEPATFLSGLDRPLPLMTDPQGNLVVGDYATGVIYQVHYGEAQGEQ